MTNLHERNVSVDLLGGREELETSSLMGKLASVHGIHDAKYTLCIIRSRGREGITDVTVVFSSPRLDRQRQDKYGPEKESKPPIERRAK
jgi:hypothetical protein